MAMKPAFNRPARADSFYQKETEGEFRLAEARQTITSTLSSQIVNYVLNRQNQDGGYTFCQGAESNAQDTYYGLAILRSLNAEAPDVEKTADFLKEIRVDSIYPVYYVAKAMLLLGKGINADLQRQVSAILGSQQFFGSSGSPLEASSEFTTTLMGLELADLLKIEIVGEKVARWLVSLRNGDGGFGAEQHSNINSTFYAVASLRLLKQNFDSKETVAFVRGCEKPHGGFTVLPVNFTPYMEHTYYGVTTLSLLGEKARYPQQTADWVLSCQNRNGGFARSDLGISTFRDTYFAVATLHLYY